MKVYEMDDWTWYAGESTEDVKRAYLEDTSYSVELDEGYPRELTEEDMQRLRYVTDMYNEPDVSVPFADALARMVSEGKEFPCFFATTEI